MRACHLTSPWGFVHAIEDLDSSVSFQSYRLAREYALHMLRNAMNFPVTPVFWLESYIYGSRDTACDKYTCYDPHRGEAPTYHQRPPLLHY